MNDCLDTNPNKEEEEEEQEDHFRDQGGGSGNARRYEQEHVHDIYESIASHFSQTRYKPWPIVADFLARQPVGSIGLDLGSGNGKYLHAHNVTHIIHPKRTTSSKHLEQPKAGIKSSSSDGGGGSSDSCVEDRYHKRDDLGRYLMLGLDRSRSLLSLSRSTATTTTIDRSSSSLPEVIHGDCLSLPFRSNLRFDFIISIATLHHLSTHERRLEAIENLLSSILPPPTPSSDHPPTRTGRALIFVWAHEQGQRSRRKWDRQGALLPAPQLSSSSTTSISPRNMQGVGDPSVASSSSPSLSSLQDVLVPWTLNTSSDVDSNQERPLKTYNRYYHLFREGELIELVRLASERLQLSFRLDSTTITPNESSSIPPRWCWVKRHGWEADNWWIELELGRTS